MDGNELLYTLPSGEKDLREIMKITRTVREGCEPFTHCALDGEKAAECFLMGKTPEGKTEKLIFSYGGTVYALGGGTPEIRTDGIVTPFGNVTGGIPAVAEYIGTAPSHGNAALRLSGTQIMQSFLLMTGGKMTAGDEMRYVFRVRASRHGRSTVFGIFDTAGALMSTASVVAENEKYALIGDVFTRPDARRRGLAAEVCLECCRAALEKGKTPWLMCSAAMLPYYTRLGFRKIRTHTPTDPPLAETHFTHGNDKSCKLFYGQ